MTISTYAELEQAIQDWAIRTDTAFTNQIPEFVALAEERIYYGNEHEESDPLRARAIEVETTITMTAGVGPLPSDYLEMRALTRDNDPVGLDYLPPHQFEAIKTELTGTGVPGYYTVKASNVEIAPGWTGTLDALYYQRLPVLTTGTNAILTAHPNLYLWASLVEAMQFVGNEKKQGDFGRRYNGSVSAVNRVNGRGQRSGTLLRTQVPLTGAV